MDLTGEIIKSYDGESVVVEFRFEGKIRTEKMRIVNNNKTKDHKSSLVGRKVSFSLPERGVFGRVICYLN